MGRPSPCFVFRGYSGGCLWPSGPIRPGQLQLGDQLARGLGWPPGSSFLESVAFFFESVPSYCRWTQSISHQIKTMGNHCLLVFTRESSHGFLGGAGFRPSTVWLPCGSSHGSVISCQLLGMSRVCVCGCYGLIRKKLQGRTKKNISSLPD